MSRILLMLMVLFVSGSLVWAQESGRRRPVRLEALWPVFESGQQSKGVQIGLRGLGQMAPDSAARIDLAAAVLKALVKAGELNAAGAWLKNEPALSQSCTAWARLAVGAARRKDEAVWKRASAEAERLAAISSLREGRAGWVLLYEAALMASPADADRFLPKLPHDDFESQSDLKGVELRRLGDGLEPKMNEAQLKELLAPPPTEASLNLMAYALGLVEIVRGGACDGGLIPFSAVAGQAVTCALESAANPAPVLVAMLTEAERLGFESSLPVDDWFQKATQFLAIANLDEEKPSYLLDMAWVAERRGRKGDQKPFLGSYEESLVRLEASLQPEGYFRLGQTHVRRGECAQAWKVWKQLLNLLESNPNRDLWFQISGEMALEIDSWSGDGTDFKASCLAEIEARVGGLN